VQELPLNNNDFFNDDEDDIFNYDDDDSSDDGFIKFRFFSIHPSLLIISPSSIQVSSPSPPKANSKKQKSIPFTEVVQRK
jgi:hypothetical protein